MSTKENILNTCLVCNTVGQGLFCNSCKKETINRCKCGVFYLDEPRCKCIENEKVLDDLRKNIELENMRDDVKAHYDDQQVKLTALQTKLNELKDGKITKEEMIEYMNQVRGGFYMPIKITINLINGETLVIDGYSGMSIKTIKYYVCKKLNVMGGVKLHDGNKYIFADQSIKVDTVLTQKK